MRLAQLNIARPRYPLDDPRMAGFTNNLGRINALAGRSPGFVCRLPTEGPDGTPEPEGMIATLSVWEDVASLGAFVFNTIHARFHDRRAEWFAPLDTPNFVMWPVEDAHRPTLAEGLERLDRLHRHGPGPEAFGWDHVDTGPWRGEVSA